MNHKWSAPTDTCQMEDGTTKEIGRLKPREHIVIRGEVCEVVSVQWRDVRDFPEVKVEVEALYAHTEMGR